MEEMKYLVMVNPGENNNKFYRMVPHGSSWTAEYGRVGAVGVKKDYPMSSFYEKYEEKIRKGYRDETYLHSEDKVVVKSQDKEYAPIPDSVIDEFVTRLRTWANNAVKSSYTVKIKDVTEKMLSQAQNIMNSIMNSSDVNVINHSLLELFAILPRKMSNVSDFMMTDISQKEEITAREQDVLDLMKTQVFMREVEKNPEVSASNKKKTILEAFHLEIRKCTDKEEKEIISHLGANAHQYVQGYKVINKKAEDSFKKYCKERNIKDCSYLFHGSRNENIWGITVQGMKLNPKAVITGKMFGYGLYFASKAQKSINYSSCGCRVRNGRTGVLAIFKVATGNSLHVKEWNRSYLNYSENDIKKSGKDSMYAHAGVSLLNDEIIVYNEAAVSMRYLVEIK